MAQLYPNQKLSWSALASPVTYVRRRSGKVWGQITSIIIDPKTSLPIAAMVRVMWTQTIQRVPWTMLTEGPNGDGYRLMIGLGELALMAPEAPQSDSVLIWHDGMDWLIQKDGDGYKTTPLDRDAWVSGPPPGMTEEDLALLFSRH